MSVCYVCKKDEDCRPYGERGQFICFDCAMTPERKGETARQFASQLNGSGPVAVIDGTEVGPYPIDHAAAKAGSKK